LSIISRHSADHNAQQNSDLAFLRQQLAREAARAEHNTETPEKRKQNVLDSFKRCQVTMVVAPEDILDSHDDTLDDVEAIAPPSSTAATEIDDNAIVVETGISGEVRMRTMLLIMLFTTGSVETAADYDVEEDGCDAGYLVLRSGSTRAQLRKVPNGCAICLGPYEVSEVVVWSSNTACKHAFHEDCMLDWLCKSMQLVSQTAQTSQDSTPCPCCRQAFCDLDTYRKEKKIVAPRATFNPQLVRL
jgi:hypothetical protein